MKTTILIDNIEANNCIAEWGLSFLIEYKDKKILLDTGASNNFISNVEKLGLDLKDVDFAVLSHAHFDHSDGMDAFFEINNKAPFYVQKSSKENCFSKSLFIRKYIGIKKGILDQYKNRIIYVDNIMNVCEGVKIIGHSSLNLEKIGIKERMYLKTLNGWIPDNFSHEQSLVFECKDGIVVFNSCSHGGLLNIISEVRKEYPNKKILAYFGGLHLYNKTKKEIIELANNIKDCDIEKIYTGHCTGDKAFNILKEELKDKVDQFRCGYTYKFDD